MIRLAKVKEIEQIMTITRLCANKMTSEGILQWNEHYPSKDAFLNDVDRKELYVLLKEGRVIGSITISTYKDEEYEPVEWLTEDGLNIYIHRLAIHPEFQHQGLARRLMDFAEAFAIKIKAISVRLDTFSKNERNQRFYESRGYTRLTNIYFPMQSEHPFFCYELPLKQL